MSDIVPAATTTETAPVPSKGLSDLSSSERENWLKTGELPTEPTIEPETPTSSPATIEADVVAPVETPAKVAKPRDDINARLGQLAEQRRVEKERADKAEARIKELESGRVGDSGFKPESVQAPNWKVTESPKPPTTLELVKKYQGEPDWPKLDDYIAAGFDDPYLAVANAQTIYLNDKMTADRSEAQSARERESKAVTNVDRTLSELKTQFPDADPSVLRDLQGQSAPIFAQLLFESPLSVILLNHFSNHAAEARTIAAMEPLAAAMSLGKLESQLSTPAPSRIATKTTSDAPEPPQTLGARHTPGAVDEVEEARKSGDFPRYRDLMNKRELAGQAR